jgi:hypothetical protein
MPEMTDAKPDLKKEALSVSSWEVRMRACRCLTL